MNHLNQKTVLYSACGRYFPLPDKDKVVVGRVDQGRQIYPDIDTSSIGGEEYGVSRKHAIIRQSGGAFLIEDLGSTNATFVNRRMLAPQERRELRYGDEIRLGRITFIFATR